MDNGSQSLTPSLNASMYFFDSLSFLAWFIVNGSSYLDNCVSLIRNGKKESGTYWSHHVGMFTDPGDYKDTLHYQRLVILYTMAGYQ
jgi:hypothetical protein